MSLEFDGVNNKTGAFELGFESVGRSFGKPNVLLSEEDITSSVPPRSAYNRNAGLPDSVRSKCESLLG